MKITSIRLGPMVQRRDTDLHSFDQTYDILTRYLIFALGLIIIAKTSRRYYENDKKKIFIVVLPRNRHVPT